MDDNTVLHIASQALVLIAELAGPALVVSLAAGCFFSRWPTRGRGRLALLAYSSEALLPLLALIGWLIATGRR